MNAIEVLLPINAAIPCGLVVNELISNALKHAFPGRYRAGRSPSICAHESPTMVGFAVSDDGVGIAEDFDLAETTTLGLQLVTMLADQLGGQLEVQRIETRRASRCAFPSTKKQSANDTREGSCRRR